MKTNLISVLFGALNVYAAVQVVTEDVDESFQGSDYSFANPEACLEYYNCTVKPLPFPGDGLKWLNLQSYRVPLSDANGGEIQDVGLVPIDTDLGHDYYFAKYINTSQPAIITRKYRSRVKYWELNGLDFGCTALQTQETSPGSGQNFTGVDYANCSLTVVGFGLNGRRLGTETFHSVGRWDGFTHPIQFHMTRFTTMEAGLKGKKLGKVQMTGKFEHGPGGFVGDLVLGIDEVRYTLYNTTAKP